MVAKIYSIEESYSVCLEWIKVSIDSATLRQDKGNTGQMGANEIY
jgi:hypothetical protein